MRRFEYEFTLSAALFLLFHSTAHAAGQGPERLPQLAIMTAGIVLIPLLLYLGDGYTAIRLQKGAKTMLLSGAAISLLVLALGAAKVLGKEFAVYGAVGAAAFLIGMIPWPAGGGGVTLSAMVKLAAAGLAAGALAAVGAVLDLENAPYPLAMAGLWYGAYLIITAFDTPPLQGVNAKRLGYAGVAMVTFGLLLLAFLLGQSIQESAGRI